MQVTIMNFNNFSLDFSTNYFVSLEFSFKDNIYKFQVTKNSTNELLIYCKNNFIIKNPQANTFYKANGFNIAFVVENFITQGLVDDKDFGSTTIFNKYKLGIFYDA